MAAEPAIKGLACRESTRPWSTMACGAGGTTTLVVEVASGSTTPLVLVATLEVAAVVAARQSAGIKKSNAKLFRSTAFVMNPHP